MPEQGFFSASSYEELKRRARDYLRRRGPTTAGVTSLVHETWLRLCAKDRAPWKNEVHFAMSAAQAMRHVLIEQVRRHASLKRGRGWERVSLSQASCNGLSLDLLDLDAALTALSELDPRQAKVVELRYFGGATIDETASLLAVSTNTVEREWRAARAWLSARLSDVRDDT